MSLRAKAKNSDTTPRERFKGARYISDCNIRDFQKMLRFSWLSRSQHAELF